LQCSQLLHYGETTLEHVVHAFMSLLSRTKEVDLIFFIFPFLFYFIFDLFSFILFLEPGLGLE